MVWLFGLKQHLLDKVCNFYGMCVTDLSLLPYCFVKCHSMAVYCSTPANHSLASGMQQFGPSFAQPLIVIIGGYELDAFVYDKWLYIYIYRVVYNQ